MSHNIAVIVIAIAGLLLIACGGADDPASQAGSGGTASATRSVKTPSSSTDVAAMSTDVPTPARPRATATPARQAGTPAAPEGTPADPSTGQILVAGATGTNSQDYRVHLVNADGSDLYLPVPKTTVPGPPLQAFPVWSPDGQQFAFVTPRDQEAGITISSADGSDTYSLPTSVAARDLAWSPNGYLIAFASVGDPPMIGVIDVASGQERQVIGHPDSGMLGDLNWSPDGHRLAYAWWPDQGVPDIWIVNADGAGPRQLTHGAGHNTDPAWSPDGRQIAFRSDRDGNEEIYVMDAYGSNLLRLTDNDVPDGSPAWSPDGTRIAFTSDGDIYVMSPDGSNARNLTNTPDELDLGPAWSPDRTQLVYLSQPAGLAPDSEESARMDVRVIQTDGSGSRTVVEDVFFEPFVFSFPIWRPQPDAVVPVPPGADHHVDYEDEAVLASAFPATETVSAIVGQDVVLVQSGPGGLGQEFEGFSTIVTDVSARYESDSDGPRVMVIVSLARFESQDAARQMPFTAPGMTIPEMEGFDASGIGDEAHGYVLHSPDGTQPLTMTWLALRDNDIVASIWIAREDDQDMRQPARELGARVAEQLDAVGGS